MVMRLVLLKRGKNNGTIDAEEVMGSTSAL